MKLNDSHLNVITFLFTLLAAGLYLLGAYTEMIDAQFSQGMLIAAGILLLVLLVLLGLRGFKRSFESNLPLFSAFWMLLYVALPNTAQFSSDGAANTFPIALHYLSTALPLLAGSVVALVLIHQLGKDSKHFLFYILRYLAFGVILSLLCMSVASALFLPSLDLDLRFAVLEAADVRTVLNIPLLFGGLCLCADLTATLDPKNISRTSSGAETSRTSASAKQNFVSHLPTFFCLSLLFCVVTLFFGSTGLWQMEMILLGKRFRVACAVIVLLLGSLLLAKKTTLDDWDSELSGYTNHITACSMFAWTVYSLLSMVWTQFFHPYVFFFGVSIAMLVYAFLRRFHSQLLPLMSRSDNTFLAAFWGVTLLLLLAAGRTVQLRPFYLLLVVLLLIVRYICRVLADKGQHPLVMHSFWGVAALLLLLGTRLDLSALSLLSPFKLAASLCTAFFWCVICFFMERTAHDNTHIYDGEYAMAIRLRTWIPVVMAFASLILLLFL